VDAIGSVAVLLAVEGHDDIARANELAAVRLIEIVRGDMKLVMLEVRSQALETIQIESLGCEQGRYSGRWRFDPAAVRRDDGDRRTAIDRHDAIVDELAFGHLQFRKAAIS